MCDLVMGRQPNNNMKGRKPASLDRPVSCSGWRAARRKTGWELGHLMCCLCSEACLVGILLPPLSPLHIHMLTPSSVASLFASLHFDISTLVGFLCLVVGAITRHSVVLLIHSFLSFILPSSHATPLSHYPKSHSLPAYLSPLPTYSYDDLGFLSSLHFAFLTCTDILHSHCISTHCCLSTHALSVLHYKPCHTPCLSCYFPAAWPDSFSRGEIMQQPIL